MIVSGVQMFSGLAPEGASGPLLPVIRLCGLTLGGGDDCAENRQPERRRDHLKLVAGHGRAP